MKCISIDVNLLLDKKKIFPLKTEIEIERTSAIMINFPITLNTTYSVLVQEYIIKQDYNYILVDIDNFILLVYGQTIDITVRDRKPYWDPKPYLIGWSMRITFDVTRRRHFPCIFRVRVLCSPCFK